MVERIIVSVIVYLLLGYTWFMDRKYRNRRDVMFYFGLVSLSGYLSFAFISGRSYFNLDDLLDLPFEVPAKVIFNYFKS